MYLATILMQVQWPVADADASAGKKLHVTGSTGIGKSCWLARQLLEKVQEGRIVVMQPQGRTTVFMFSQ